VRERESKFKGCKRENQLAIKLQNQNVKMPLGNMQHQQQQQQQQLQEQQQPQHMQHPLLSAISGNNYE